MMTDDQLYSLVERCLLSFEKIAAALDGLNETYKKQYHKRYPERGEVREAVVSRIPSEEDRIREAQGASNQPLNAWLGELDEEEEKEDIGTREQEWLERHAGAQG